MNKKFWEKLIENELAIVCFRAYSRQEDENGTVDDKNFIGLKFSCLPCDTISSIKEGEFYLYSESSCGDLEAVGDTPEEAIDNYLGKR